MKYFIIIILVYTLSTSIFASPKIDSLLHELDKTIADSEMYENEKKNRIASIKAVAEYSYEESHWERLQGGNSDFVFDNIKWHDLGSDSFLTDGKDMMIGI